MLAPRFLSSSVDTSGSRDGLLQFAFISALIVAQCDAASNSNSSLGWTAARTSSSACRPTRASVHQNTHDLIAFIQQALRTQFEKLKREKSEVEARIGVRNTAIKQLTAKKDRLGMSERAAGDAKVDRSACHS